jgi:hypothetical protein
MGQEMHAKLTRIAVLLVLLLVAVGGHRVYWRNYSQAIALVQLPLDAKNPARKRVGALDFLAAWELRSGNSDFGGISGLIARGGGRFLALSDAGTLIGFGLSGRREWDKNFIAALPGTRGGERGYADRDSEAMAYDPASGRIWVSYEARHAIRRFPPSLSRIDGLKRLTFTQGWEANGGVETLVRLSDGRFVIVAETHQQPDGSNSAYLFSGDPVEPGSGVTHFGYKAPAGYRPTDAALLPDGRILLLNRRISFPSGFTAKLAILDPEEIEGGTSIAPQVIATLAPPLLVDNMEGLAVTEEGGRTIVWMMSDNNFSAFQRTLLMKFALRGPNKKPEADTAPGFETLTK